MFSWEESSLKPFPKGLQPIDFLEYFHHSGLLLVVCTLIYKHSAAFHIQVTTAQFGKLGKQSFVADVNDLTDHQTLPWC